MSTPGVFCGEKPEASCVSSLVGVRNVVHYVQSHREKNNYIGFKSIIIVKIIVASYIALVSVTQWCSRCFNINCFLQGVVELCSEVLNLFIDMALCTCNGIQGLVAQYVAIRLGTPGWTCVLFCDYTTHLPTGFCAYLHDSAIMVRCLA